MSVASIVVLRIASRRAVLTALPFTVCTFVETASAQSLFPRARLEIAAEATWSGRDDLGSQSARLTTNSSTDSKPFTLFSTSTRIDPSPGLRATVGYYVTPWLIAEAGGLFRRADVTVAIRGDTEGAPDRSFLGEQLDQYAVEGSALVKIPVNLGGRVWPFAIVGGAYRRDVHQDRSSVETGSAAYAGAGARILIRARQKGRVKGFGARTEVRAARRAGGFHLDRATGVNVTAAGGLFFMF